MRKVSNLIDSSRHLEFGDADSALSVLPLSHIFERQAMNMYLHHGMSVYFGESLELIGDNLREVHPTVFVGVPRIYEKILARVQERALAKGKLNGAICNWAIEIGKQWAELNAKSKPIPLWLNLRHKLNRGCACTDDGNTLASEVIVVIPLGRMKHLTRKSVQTIQAWSLWLGNWPSCTNQRF